MARHASGGKLLSYLDRRPRDRDSSVIGLPMTPSYWLGEPRRTKVIRLTMTCGGGMGGSRWDEFAVTDMDVDRFASLMLEDGLMVITDIDGRKRMVNPAYIVTAERLDILERDMVTSNPNYYKGPTKVTVREIAEAGLEAVWSDEFESRGD